MALTRTCQKEWDELGLAIAVLQATFDVKNRLYKDMGTRADGLPANLGPDTQALRTARASIAKANDLYMKKYKAWDDCRKSNTRKK
jgi:hypothetical protein